MSRRAPTTQLSLLDWTPPAPTVSFDEGEIRAASFAGRLSRAIALSLGDSGRSRLEIAERMSSHLGRPVSINMLNNYASPSREEHQMSVPRFAALVHATEDRRLVELLAQPMGWAAIERRFLPMIELAAVQERAEELRRQADMLRRQARGKGAL